MKTPQHNTVQVTHKASQSSARRFLRLRLALGLKIHRFMVGLITLSLVSLLFSVCHAVVLPGEILFHFDDQDPGKSTIYTEFLDDRGDQQSTTLRRYGFYEPRFTLPQYSRSSANHFGPGITIWVNADALAEEDIHFKVKLFEANLDDMLATSELAQRNFSLLSNLTKKNDKYGFSLGLIVDDHWTTTIAPNHLVSDATGAEGMAAPMDWDRVFRESFAINSGKGGGSAAMAVLKNDFFTHVLTTDTPRLNGLQATRPPVYNFSDVAFWQESQNRPVQAHHHIEIHESGIEGRRTVVAYDPQNNNQIVNVREIAALDTAASDQRRSTLFHESSHIFTMNKGEVPPLMQDKRISNFPWIVEELAVLDVVKDSSKGDFTDTAYNSEQARLRGKQHTPRTHYGDENMLGVLFRWRHLHPQSYSEWVLSGGRIKSHCGN